MVLPATEKKNETETKTEGSLSCRQCAFGSAQRNCAVDQWKKTSLLAVEHFTQMLLVPN